MSVMHLLEDAKLNDNCRPSDLPNWSSEPADIIEQLKEAGAVFQTEINQIAENNDPPTFENTIEPYEFAATKFVKPDITYSVLETFSKDARKFSDAQVGFLQIESEIFRSVVTTPKLFERIREIYETRDQFDSTSQKRLLIEATYNSFLDQGLGLDAKRRGELQSAKSELRRLENVFRFNVSANGWRFNNESVVPKMLAARARQMELLGTNKSFSEHNTSRGMVGSSEKAAALMSSLKHHYSAARELPPVPADIAVQDLRFTFADVHKCLAETVSRYLGVELRPSATQTDLPYPGMCAFDAFKNGERRGLAIIHPFNKDSKESFVGVDALQFREVQNDIVTLPIGAANFKFEASAHPTDATLSFSDVEDYFHEWAHLLRLLMVEADYTSLSGWPHRDFSETFSLIFENIAGHWSTLSGIAKDAAGNIVSDRDLRAALENSHFSRIDNHIKSENKALIDIAIHSMNTDQTPTFDDVVRHVVSTTAIEEAFVRDTLLRASQMMCGYAGSFYSYEWSDVSAKTLIASLSEGDGFLNKADAPARLSDYFQSAAVSNGAAMQSFLNAAGRPPEADTVWQQFSPAFPQAMVA